MPVMEPELAVLERIVALSTSAGSRVYMLKLPQKPTLPAVRVQRISSPRDQHLRGPLYPTVTRVQVDSYAAEASGADPYATVATLAAAIRGNGLGENASGLWGWIGTMGGSPPSIRILNVQLADDGDPTHEADELRLVRIRQDFLVHWSPAA